MLIQLATTHITCKMIHCGSRQMLVMFYVAHTNDKYNNPHNDTKSEMKSAEHKYVKELYYGKEDKSQPLVHGVLKNNIASGNFYNQ